MEDAPLNDQDNGQVGDIPQLTSDEEALVDAEDSVEFMEQTTPADACAQSTEVVAEEQEPVVTEIIELQGTLIITV
jgi:hypothetical protein